MCGRYTLFAEHDIAEVRDILNALNKRYANAVDNGSIKTGEIFPTNTAPVLLPGRNGMRADAMRWGYPPFSGSRVIINARSETAASKPLFRNGLLNRRLVVPTTGFYEWSHEGKKAVDKYHITAEDNKMLYLAGLYEMFRQPDGSEYPAFVILTAAANATVAALHDRMPVALPKSLLKPWLNGDEDIIALAKNDGVQLRLDIAV